MSALVVLPQMVSLSFTPPSSLPHLCTPHPTSLFLLPLILFFNYLLWAEKIGSGSYGFLPIPTLAPLGGSLPASQPPFLFFRHRPKELGPRCPPPHPCLAHFCFLSPPPCDLIHSPAFPRATLAPFQPGLYLSAPAGPPPPWNGPSPGWMASSQPCAWGQRA